MGTVEVSIFPANIMKSPHITAVINLKKVN